MLIKERKNQRVKESERLEDRAVCTHTEREKLVAKAGGVLQRVEVLCDLQGLVHLLAPHALLPNQKAFHAVDVV